MRVLSEDVGDYTSRVVTYGETMEDCGALDDAATCRRVNLTGVLFEPVAADTVRDVAALVIHGGGFFYGNACGCFSQSVGSWLASRGVRALSVDYRLEGDRGLAPVDGVFVEDYANAWHGTWRVVPTDMFSAIRDARAAVRYLRAAVGAARVVATGHSAGACAALALAALSGDDAALGGVYRDEVDDPSLGATNPSASSAVDGAITFAATIDGVAALLPGAPGSQSWGVGAKPPLLLVHGLADVVNAPENSGWVVDGSGYGGAATGAFYAAEGHSLYKPAFDAARERAATWLDAELGVEVAASPAVGADVGDAACPPLAHYGGHHGYWDCPKRPPEDDGGPGWRWLASALLLLSIAALVCAVARRARDARRRRTADDAGEASALAGPTTDDGDSSGLELVDRTNVVCV